MNEKPKTLLGEEQRERWDLFRKERIQRGGPIPPEEFQYWDTALRTPHGFSVIGREGNPYLMRVFLLPRVTNSLGGTSVYLHYFFRGDSDRNPHNHPWKESRSLILTGGYKEFRLHRGPKECWWSDTDLYPGTWNHIERGTYHRVELFTPNKGCWTLFVAGERVPAPFGEEWGFYDVERRVHVAWSRYKEQPKDVSR